MKAFKPALQILTSKINDKATPSMDDAMTLENYKEVFNKTKESTASSPSGIHYGHYKAACESDVLAKVNLIFMVVPFKVGRPLTRWTNSLHCMIQKVKKPYVKKLRIVQLYEADFNTMMKIMLGKRLMGHSENMD